MSQQTVALLKRVQALRNGQMIVTAVEHVCDYRFVRYHAEGWWTCGGISKDYHPLNDGPFGTCSDWGTTRNAMGAVAHLTGSEVELLT